MHYKRVIFDMDGTLTESYGNMLDSMRYHFEELCRVFTVAVLSGADVARMKSQIPFDHFWEGGRNLYLMALSGNISLLNDQVLWKNMLSWRDKLAIFEHISALRAAFPFSITDESDLVEDHGAQVAFSFIGHHASREKKAAFDAERVLRHDALCAIPFIHPSVTVKVGGTTCLDYTQKNGTKADNALRLFREAGLVNTLFIGDNLDPGGNDEPMLFVTDCIAVKGPYETEQIIRTLLRDAVPENIIPANRTR
ncbi:MAG: hypothetical protein A3D67_00750 [Candidatus Lloydbacteria bacterium RIFCSPHIGHO2_02_FULL_51_22]|uniref:Phosphomannomutase n=3 Tax=Candidatus Lloydiibacteriota TaxID=1817910 RepID=A0A1G2DHI4_9BACT|nr:MAG: hypothetical protein A3D67_00750 [Candidatus Lloydbacteria bacterium RIFCSPHIGHO2_02_FULL_51_22]OGZ15891.1 MAG: hypothetical protein A3J08_04620 [Candidatus Lloydbacteria bacterium RIFCSPLOWO2_02_FULL_51_11]OGZ16665.1 MAG: hypothetical protein A3G11_02975 [Candidatus Lloydbacteria bacterium RIFCSPLOWO2_12_FULL_51_9]